MSVEETGVDAFGAVFDLFVGLGLDFELKEVPAVESIY